MPMLGDENRPMANARGSPGGPNRPCGCRNDLVGYRQNPTTQGRRESWWLDIPRRCSRFPTSLLIQPVADNPCAAGSDRLSGPPKMRPRMPWSVRRVGRTSSVETISSGYAGSTPPTTTISVRIGHRSRSAHQWDRCHLPVAPRQPSRRAGRPHPRALASSGTVRALPGERRQFTRMRCPVGHLDRRCHPGASLQRSRESRSSFTPDRGVSSGHGQDALASSQRQECLPPGRAT